MISQGVGHAGGAGGTDGRCTVCSPVDGDNSNNDDDDNDSDRRSGGRGGGVNRRRKTTRAKHEGYAHVGGMI